ncbi:hypothetical protein Pint_11154 [Pistacia integerrima]|uniref:Uncharacterized protein n=1 Tax=Pistacia integerrima TaxID=434235 RepID=A0ACC0XGF7_9ROSI|nr:hypothetical protein Pint_11154 [Pistacia integerrima]
MGSKVVAHGSLERDDEDVYFDDESAEVVISSLRLGDNQESGSLFTNSNWFAFEEERINNDRSTGSPASPSPNNEEAAVTNGGGDDEVVVGEDEDLDDTATSPAVPETKSEDTDVVNLPKDSEETGPSATEKPPVWVEWRETPDSSNPSDATEPVSVPNGEVQVETRDEVVDCGPDASEPSSSSSNEIANADATPAGELSQTEDENKSASSNPVEIPQPDDGNPSPEPINSDEAKTVVEAAQGTPEVNKSEEAVKETEN